MDVDKSVGQLNRVPQFDGTHYFDWRVKMKAYLQALGMDVYFATQTGWSSPIKKGGTAENPIEVYKPFGEWTEDEKKAASANSKGLNALFQSVTGVEFSRIAGAQTSKEAWDILARAHDGDKTVKDRKAQLLVMQFENIKMEEDEKV